MRRDRVRQLGWWVLPAVVAATAAAYPGSRLSAADLATGQHLFESNCVICHKSDGSGGVKLGTAVSADLRAPMLEKLYHDDDALLSRAILHGKDQDGEALDPVMPHWGGQLTRQEVASVIVFLKTLRQ